MLRRETAQKAIICVLLAVVMIALVAVFAAAGLNMPAQTAYADNEFHSSCSSLTRKARCSSHS